MMEMPKNLESVKISALENIIINFATPIESIFEAIFGWLIPPRPTWDSYFAQYGVWDGYCKSKTDSYRRLIQAAEDGTVPKRVLGLYDSTLCGSVMVLTYRFIRQ